MTARRRWSVTSSTARRPSGSSIRRTSARSGPVRCAPSATERQRPWPDRRHDAHGSCSTTAGWSRTESADRLAGALSQGAGAGVHDRLPRRLPGGLRRCCSSTTRACSGSSTAGWPTQIDDGFEPRCHTCVGPSPGSRRRAEGRFADRARLAWPPGRCRGGRRTSWSAGIRRRATEAEPAPALDLLDSLLGLGGDPPA